MRGDVRPKLHHWPVAEEQDLPIHEPLNASLAPLSKELPVARQYRKSRQATVQRPMRDRRLAHNSTMVEKGQYNSLD